MNRWKEKMRDRGR